MSEEMIEVIARLVAPEWFTENGEPPIINNYPDQHLGYQAIARDKAREIMSAYNPNERLREAGKVIAIIKQAVAEYDDGSVPKGTVGIWLFLDQWKTLLSALSPLP